MEAPLPCAKVNNLAYSAFNLPLFTQSNVEDVIIVGLFCVVRSFTESASSMVIPSSAVEKRCLLSKFCFAFIPYSASRWSNHTIIVTMSLHAQYTEGRFNFELMEPASFIQSSSDTTSI